MGPYSNQFSNRTVFEKEIAEKYYPLLFPAGRYFITNYLTFWPGGKKKADTIINSLGDNVSAMLGWLFLYFLLNDPKETIQI